MNELQIKGTTQLDFVLSAFDTSIRDIVQIVAVFGTGDYTVYNADVSLPTFVQPVTSVSYTYNAQYTSYVTYLSAVFQVVYSNLAIINYVQPLQLLQSSYYDEVGHIHITSSQLLPVSSNDVVLTCYDDYSNLHNFVLHQPAH